MLPRGDETVLTCGNVTATLKDGLCEVVVGTASLKLISVAVMIKVGGVNVEVGHAGVAITGGKARFWERLGGTAATAFNDRQLMVINRLLDGFEGKLTSSKWASLAKCSQDAALRDIDDLVRRGVVARNPAGGRSTSYSLILT